MPDERPPVEEWSRFAEICQRLRNLSGAQFEQLGYALLLKQGRRISDAARLIPGGLTFVRALTPRQGPIDAALVSGWGGDVVVAAYGVMSNPAGWEKKFEDDLAKIRAALEVAGAGDVKMVFMTTLDLQPEDVLAAQLRHVDERTITGIEIRPLREIGQQLDIIDVDLADRFLDVQIPLERLVRLTAESGDRPDLPLPRRADFDAGLVYLPIARRDAVCDRLQMARRCVLVGAPASGKSWLAAAFARWAEPNIGRTAYYVDARRSQAGDGRAWFREAVRWNDSRPLIVIDNCQGAPDEVGEFCRWFDATPKRVSDTAVILVLTAPDAPPSTEGGDDPVADWAGAYGVEVCAEDVWQPMVQAYGRFLRDTDASRYADVDEELRADVHEALARRHAHDLAASRARLEAWRDQGGRLSAVSDDSFYHYLDRRYVVPAPDLMRVVCALWAYEVPAHQRFLTDATAGHTERLAEEGLLVEEESRIYGRCLRPAIHRNLAREVFRACVRRDNPQALQSPERESDYLVRAYRDYLLRRPLNAARLYRALHQAGEAGVLARLLVDEKVVQAGLASIDEWPSPDVPLFLVALHTQNPGKVSDEIARLRGDPAWLASFVAGLQRAPTALFLLAVALLRKLDDALAGQVVRLLDADPLASGLQYAALGTVRGCLYLLMREQYPRDRLDKVLSSLSPESLGAREYQGNLQPLCWLALALDRLGARLRRDPAGAGQQLLRKLGGKRLAEIWRRTPRAAPMKFFFHVAADDVREQMVKELSDEECATLLVGCDLKDLANAMQQAPSLRRRGFDGLRKSGRLKERILSASAAEIGVCLHVCRQQHNSPHVARDILEEVVAAGRYERFLEAEDLLALALLVHHGTQINPPLAYRVATALEDEVLTRRALARSSLNGIQLLLHNLAQLREPDEPRSPAEARLAEGLGRVDLSAAVRAATLRVTDYFVWNVHELVDRALARAYAPSLQEKLESTLDAAPFGDVSCAVWTLAKVFDGDGGFVQGLLPGLQARTEAAEHAEPGSLLALVGCVESLAPGATSVWTLPTVGEASARLAVESPLSRPEPQGLLAALILLGAARMLGPARIRELWTPDELRRLDASLRPYGPQPLPRRAVHVFEKVRGLFGWDPPGAAG